jgi:hypothetical protein
MSMTSSKPLTKLRTALTALALAVGVGRVGAITLRSLKPKELEIVLQSDPLELEQIKVEEPKVEGTLRQRASELATLIKQKEEELERIPEPAFCEKARNSVFPCYSNLFYICSLHIMIYIVRIY